MLNRSISVNSTVVVRSGPPATANNTAQVKKIVSVPDGMPFDQQGNLAEQQNAPHSTSKSINEVKTT